MISAASHARIPSATGLRWLSTTAARNKKGCADEERQQCFNHGSTAFATTPSNCSLPARDSVHRQLVAGKGEDLPQKPRERPGRQRRHGARPAIVPRPLP